ncbi:MAG: PrsW family intramembrane metalloprotease [Thermoanaerobaculales bacterium]|jgi:RsiW-degrading membrane proteinase PrsW (M82 family)|nr:PrsW family intramembrane metalloprotease [Thermoanaerobaculales bacterium]
MILGDAVVLLACLLVSAAILLAVVGLTWFIDRYDREPLHLVAAVFLWGAAAAPTLAVLALTGLERQGLTTALPGLFSTAVAGPLVEELCKALGVVLVVLLARSLDNPTDGLVYGTAAGLGFAVTENALYGMGAGAAGEATVGGLLLLTIGRTLFSAGVHAISSATFGGLVGHAVLARRLWIRASWACLGLVAATAMHGAWNGALVLAGVFTADGALRAWLVIVPAVYLAYLVVFALFLRSEHSILKRQLAQEVELGLAPPWVVDIMPYYRRRVRGDWWPVRRERAIIARLLTRVAFRKHALRHLPASEAAIASLEVIRLRQRVREILAPRPSTED